ncbi:hypothetical protein Cdeb_02657 [Caldibacillus debilis GB1]|uniref:Uncharacterized protein n=1 Tax=Caldibacillus debilis GB1 TaxID=1339248 RepID=A0A420VJ60_9BACI|nr:hypothetical protein Cdeb_02657 [Caldibacillus debilis GB1]
MREKCRVAGMDLDHEAGGMDAEISFTAMLLTLPSESAYFMKNLHFEKKILLKTKTICGINIHKSLFLYNPYRG